MAPGSIGSRRTIARTSIVPYGERRVAPSGPFVAFFSIPALLITRRQSYLGGHLMNAKTSEEARNEEAIRSLYALVEGNAKD